MKLARPRDRLHAILYAEFHVNLIGVGFDCANRNNQLFRHRRVGQPFCHQ